MLAPLLKRSDPARIDTAHAELETLFNVALCYPLAEESLPTPGAFGGATHTSMVRHWASNLGESEMCEVIALLALAARGPGFSGLTAWAQNIQARSAALVERQRTEYADFWADAYAPRADENVEFDDDES